MKSLLLLIGTLAVLFITILVFRGMGGQQPAANSQPPPVTYSTTGQLTVQERIARMAAQSAAPQNPTNQTPPHNPTYQTDCAECVEIGMNRANVWQEPQNGAALACSLPWNTEVTVGESDGMYVYIDGPGCAGWISSRLLIPLP